MQRNTQIKQPGAILTSDWHLREDKPICRIDDFFETQWKKVDFIKQLQAKYNCPVLHAGDLFDHWKPSPYLLSKTIEYLPKQFYTVYGNHDLPQHNINLAEKCGIYTLYKSKVVEILDGCHWNQYPKESSIGIETSKGKNIKYADGITPEFYKTLVKEILLWHIMTYQGQKPWSDCPSPTAIKLLKKYPQYDLIITGDNHKPFVEEYQGRLLVNPGSLSRQSASETHKPRVYLWFVDKNTVKPVYIPIKEDAVSREHLDIIENRNERIDAFVNRLNNDYETTVSFEDNLKKFEQTNKIRKSVMNIIYKSIE